MSIETQVTRAILEDGFTPVLRKIAGAQDDYARKTAGMNIGANLLLGAGSALLGFGVASIKVAGQLAEVKTAMAAVEGANKAAFDMDYVDKFAQHSKFTYLDLAEAAKRLALQNVNVKDTLGDVADVAAASGKPLAQVAQLYDALLGGRRVGLALSARGGFSQYGISTRDIFKAAGIPYNPGQRLQDAMTPEQVQAAVHKVLVDSGRSGLNEKLARTTLSGAEGMIQDALTRIGNNVAGGKNLTDTVQLLDTVADDLNKIADAAAKVPNLGEKILGGGAALIAAGGIMKAVAAWRDYRNYVNLAKIAADAERAGEKAKVPVAAAEGEAVAGSAVKYAGLRGWLLKTGEASLGARAATTGLTGTMAAGIGTVGLYAVAIAGAVFDIDLLVKSFQEANDASRKFEDSIAAVNKARAMGYDLKANAGQAQGYNALPVWAQVMYEIGDTATFGGLGAITGHRLDADGSGSSALSDAQSVALAKKHGRVKGGVMDQLIAKQKADAAAARKARLDAAKSAAADVGSAANKYELDPALEYKLSKDERQVALLKEMGGHEKELKAAREQEIADLNKAADLLEKQSKLATDIKKKYDLLNQSDEDRQKAKLLGIEGEKDKRDKLDKTTASILGGGGLSEGDILKRAGISAGNIAHLKGKPVNALGEAIKAAAKRPLIINLRLGDKTFETIKTEIVEDGLQALLHLSASSGRNLLFGH